MQKGFTYEVAPMLVTERPGMTQREVASLAHERGLLRSDSKDPVQSAGSTLAKEVREGRHSTVCSRREGGVLRYYPVSSDGAVTPNQHASAPKGVAHAISIHLPQATLEVVDLLAESKGITRPAALEWLIEQAIQAGDGMEEVRRGAAAIRQIKTSLSQS